MSIILFSLCVFCAIHFTKSQCTIGNYCNDNVPCSTNGSCFPDIFQYFNSIAQNKTASCNCKMGYTSRPMDIAQCCYKKKKQLVAFLLELCLSIGIGHFYYGNIVLGVIKLLLVLLLIIIICCSYCFLLYSEMVVDKTKESISMWIINGCIILFAVGYFIDLLLLGINFYTDNNGVPLKPW